MPVHKDPTPINKNPTDVLTDLFVRLAADSRYGTDFVGKLKSVTDDPQYNNQVFVLNTFGDFTGCLQTLADYVNDKATAQAVPGALRTFYKVMGNKLEFTALEDASTVRRPKEVGLIEAINGLCNAKENPNTRVKMINATFDPAALRTKGARIDVLRESTRAAMGFVGGLNRTLVTEETGAFDTLSKSYGKMRPVVQMDEELTDITDDTDTYLYGAAVQGAETTKLRKKQKDQMTTDATATARATVHREVQTGVGQAIADLVNQLQSSAPLETPATHLPAGAMPVSTGSTAPDPRKRNR